MSEKSENDPYQSVVVGENLALHAGVAKDFDVEVKKVEDEYFGGSRKKSRAKTRKIQESTESTDDSIDMFIKEVWLEGESVVGEEVASDPISLRYYERWMFLRKIGIPTLDDMWVVDSSRVAMEDLRSLGYTMFGKAKLSELVMEIMAEKKRPLTVEENIFLDIDLDEIYLEAKRLQEIAWSNGALLPSDDQWEMKINKEGEWSLIVLDLERLACRKNEPESYLKIERDYFVKKRYSVMRDYLLRVKL